MGAVTMVRMTLDFGVGLPGMGLLKILCKGMGLLKILCKVPPF